MFEGTITSPLVLSSNSSDVIFQNEKRTRNATCCGFLQHNEGSPVFTIIEPGLYDLDLTATITSETVGIVNLTIKEDDSPLLGTLGAETLGAVGDLVNISSHTTIRVCPRGSTQIEIGSVPSIITDNVGTATATQIPTIISATFTIKRKSGC